MNRMPTPWYPKYHENGEHIQNLPTLSTWNFTTGYDIPEHHHVGEHKLPIPLVTLVNEPENSSKKSKEKETILTSSKSYVDASFLKNVQTDNIRKESTPIAFSSLGTNSRNEIVSTAKSNLVARNKASVNDDLLSSQKIVDCVTHFSVPFKHRAAKHPGQNNKISTVDKNGKKSEIVPQKNLKNQSTEAVQKKHKTSRQRVFSSSSDYPTARDSESNTELEEPLNQKEIVPNKGSFGRENGNPKGKAKEKRVLLPKKSINTGIYNKSKPETSHNVGSTIPKEKKFFFKKQSLNKESAEEHIGEEGAARNVDTALCTMSEYQTIPRTVLAFKEEDEQKQQRLFQKIVWKEDLHVKNRAQCLGTLEKEYEEGGNLFTKEERNGGCLEGEVVKLHYEMLRRGQASRDILIQAGHEVDVEFNNNNRERFWKAVQHEFILGLDIGFFKEMTARRIASKENRDGIERLVKHIGRYYEEMMIKTDEKRCLQLQKMGLKREYKEMKIMVKLLLAKVQANVKEALHKDGESELEAIKALKRIGMQHDERGMCIGGVIGFTPACLKIMLNVYDKHTELLSVLTGVMRCNVRVS